MILFRRCVYYRIFNLNLKKQVLKTQKLKKNGKRTKTNNS